MIGEDDIKRAAEAGLQELGNPELFLVEVRRMPGDEFEVTVDSDGRVTVDDCIVLSRAIEGRFDRDAEDFALTVSSAGIGQPLKVARQYLKLVGKPAEVVLTDGTKILGTLEGFEPGTAGAVKAGVPGKSAAEADKAGVISKIAAGADKGSSAGDVGADKGGRETGGRDNVMVGGTAGSCGAGDRSDPGNGGGGNDDRSDRSHRGGIEGGSISISYPEKRKVEGKKKPEVATVTRTFPLAQVKTTKEYMDFK